jgi:hypothetical protein
MTSIWKNLKSMIGKQDTPSPLEAMLERARLVDGHTIIDQYGDLYHGVSKKDSAVGEESISQDTAGLDIKGKSGVIWGFHEVYTTSSGQYVAKLGASLFLIGPDRKLLSEGGHVLLMKEGTLYTGYGTDIHANSGQLNPDFNRLIGTVFKPHPLTGELYVNKRPNMRR